MSYVLDSWAKSDGVEQNRTYFNYISIVNLYFESQHVSSLDIERNNILN